MKWISMSHGHPIGVDGTADIKRLMSAYIGDNSFTLMVSCRLLSPHISDVYRGSIMHTGGVQLHISSPRESGVFLGFIKSCTNKTIGG